MYDFPRHNLHENLWRKDRIIVKREYDGTAMTIFRITIHLPLRHSPSAAPIPM